MLELTLLVLISMPLICSRPAWAEWRVNVEVSGSGAYCEGLFTGADFAGQRAQYESMGEEGYKDFWAATIKSYLGWTVFKSSMKVDIDLNNLVMKLIFNIQEVVEIKSYRQTIDLKPLKDDGWSWTQEGNCFIFEIPVFPTDIGFIGPFKITVCAPTGALDLRFNQANYEISYLTAIPFPLTSILIGLLSGIIILLIIGKKKLDHQRQITK